MKDFTFENQGANTYLVYKISEQDIVDTMSLGMLTNNKIQGLAETMFMQMDNKKFIKFNVSSKVSVSQFFSGPVNKKRIMGVFSGIVDAMLSAEDYMIDINTIIMDLDYIFTDVSTCETVLVCLPVVQTVQDENIDLGIFFKNIMFTTQFDQTENCDYVAKIINYLNSTPMFSLNDFKKVLESIGSVNNVNIPRQTAQQSVSGKQPVASGKQPIADQRVVKGQINNYNQPKPQNEPIKNTKSYNVPQNNINQQNTVPIQNNSIPEPQSDEKKISWFYLMQHYNKENAQLYKAQKAAKKNKGTPQTPQMPQNNPKKQPNSQQANVSFNIPGVPDNTSNVSNMGFAIPGQASSPPVQSKPVNQPAVAPKAEPVLQPDNIPKQSVQTMQQPVQQPSTQPVQTQPVQPQGRPMNFGETMVLGSNTIGETTVLNADVQKVEKVMPYLLRAKNNEKISVNKPVFRIGKERSYVDYFISDNTAISRSHANIISREGKYYITDTNSTNHTYINGKMIQSNDEVEIKHGTKFCLANEDFEFRLY